MKKKGISRGSKREPRRTSTAPERKRRAQAFNAGNRAFVQRTRREVYKKMASTASHTEGGGYVY